MLIIEADMTRAAKLGANIAEVKKVSERVVTLSNGVKEKRPIWGSVYIDGLPLGESPNPGQVVVNDKMCNIDPNTQEVIPENVIKAPIALETGDRLLFVDMFPNKWLYEVHRDGKLAWAEKELHAKEDARAARQSEKLEARTKAGI